MRKKSLMYVAALSMGLLATSCTRDVNFLGVSNEESVENAERQLGIRLDPEQDWVTVSQNKAEVTVNGEYGATYTVKVYEENPFLNGNTGTLLGKAEVKQSGLATIDFVTGMGTDLVYVAVVDEKGYTYVKPVAIADNKVSAVFTATGAVSAARTRTATNSSVNIPTANTQAAVELAAEILGKSVEVTSDNYNFNNYDATTYVQAGSEAKYTGWDYTYVYNNWTDAEKDWWVSKTNWDGNVFNADLVAEAIRLGYEKLLYKEGGNEEVVNWNTNYVTNFKVSSNWNGVISAMGNVGQKVVKYHVTSDSQLVVDESEYVPKTVYIADGGKWTISSGTTQTIGQGAIEDFVDAIVIVGKGGELEVNGTMNFANLARLIVLDGGKVTGSGLIQVNNGSKQGEESINLGTISVAKLNQNFGNFFNYGTLESDQLIGGAGTSTFVNQGTVKVGSVLANGEQSANLQIKNNCWFEVKNWMYCKIFENGADAYAKMGNIAMSDGEGGEGLGTYIAVDSNSRFEVTGKTKLNGTLITGPTTDYAYMELGTIDFLNVGATYPVTNNINLYVAGYGGDNPEGFKTSFEEYDINATGNGHVNLIQQKQVNTVAIDASDCAPEFVPEESTPVYDNNPIYSYAFEDTRLGDYDLNDVVLQVSENSSDNTKLDIKLVAAGATFNIVIKYNGQALSLNGKTEIHDILGVDRGVMVNTGVEGSAGATADPVVFTVAKPQGDVKLWQLPIVIAPSGQQEVDVAVAGQDPHGVVIPGNWKWPRERVKITSAYPKFADFASDVDAAWKDDNVRKWYVTYNAGTVCE